MEVLENFKEFSEELPEEISEDFLENFFPVVSPLKTRKYSQKNHLEKSPGGTFGSITG